MSNFHHVAERLSESGFLQNLSPPLQMALFLGSLVLLPAAIACLTCFTRIAIVMSFVRRGLSTQEIPPNTVLIGLSLFLTVFIMEPTLSKLNEKSVLPYLSKEITGLEAIQRGIEIHKGFMLRQTRKQDLALFLRMSKTGPIQTPRDTPITVLIP